MRIVDLSVPIAPSPSEVPEFLRTDIEYRDHGLGAADIERMFGVGPELLRDGEGWAVETFLRLGTHNSTHVDRPLHLQAREALERGEPGIFWAAHQADLSYSQIERLVNLDQLPATGFTVACFPLRLVGASAAPARVVGIVDGA